jgi:hypothetical protein
VSCLKKDQAPARVGVVVVHGIGEQRRFEHIDGQVREIIAALEAQKDRRVTCEIVSAPDSAFHATSDSWAGRSPVRVYVHEADGSQTQIEFHEVWWADINEPYSLMKQVRFWIWCLSVWLYPGKHASALSGASRVTPPVVAHPRLVEAWIRLRLFGVGFVAVLAAASIGLISFLAERILKLQPPAIIRTFVNYVAGVKLYNQQHRWGPGFSRKPLDFLDTMGEPPRVSIRRRMIRVLLGMAQANYDRWYVLAHSLGSLVAFNGLMETAYAWPGYLDSAAWSSATSSSPPFAGPPATPPLFAPHSVATSPPRPVWVQDHDVIYRSRIFERLRGVLTFGSPLEKFAAIWPARVPISEEEAFRLRTEWINVYDPTDPVSGVLKSYNAANTNCCPTLRNYGFAAGSLLLLSHLRYLRATRKNDGLSDALAHWLLTDSSAKMGQGADWFTPGSPRHHRRSMLAWLTWILAVILLLILGAITWPPVASVARKAECGVEHRLQSLGLAWLDTKCPASSSSTNESKGTSR